MRGGPVDDPTNIASFINIDSDYCSTFITHDIFMQKIQFGIPLTSRCVKNRAIVPTVVFLRIIIQYLTLSQLGNPLVQSHVFTQYDEVFATTLFSGKLLVIPPATASLDSPHLYMVNSFHMKM